MYESLLQQIDIEISRLQAARSILSGDETPLSLVQAPITIAVKGKRNLTPEGRKRIAEAVRRRWEKQKNPTAA